MQSNIQFHPLHLGDSTDWLSNHQIPPAPQRKGPLHQFSKYNNTNTTIYIKCNIRKHGTITRHRKRKSPFGLKFTFLTIRPYCISIYASYANILINWSMNNWINWPINDLKFLKNKDSHSDYFLRVKKDDQGQLRLLGLSLSEFWSDSLAFTRIKWVTSLLMSCANSQRKFDTSLFCPAPLDQASSQLFELWCKRRV